MKKIIIISIFFILILISYYKINEQQNYKGKDRQITTQNNILRQDLNQELLDAIQKDNISKVKSLISQGADVNADIKNMTIQMNLTNATIEGSPIIMAICQGKKEIVKILLDNGAKTDTLKAAIALGKKEIVEDYLKNDKIFKVPATLTIDDKDKSTFTFFESAEDEYMKKPSLLYVAVVNNQIEIVKLLLEYGESINDGWSLEDRTYFLSLDIARHKGYNNMVAFLKEKGAYDELEFREE